MRSRSVLAVVVAFAPASTLLHLHLVRAEPAAASTIARPPAAVRLWFSQRAEAAVTRVRLVGPGGAVPLDAPTVADSGVTVAVRGPVPSGAYRVEWRTMAADGHPVSGRYAFRVGTPTGR